MHSDAVYTILYFHARLTRSAARRPPARQSARPPASPPPPKQINAIRCTVRSGDAEQMECSHLSCVSHFACTKLKYTHTHRQTETDRQQQSRMQNEERNGESESQCHTSHHRSTRSGGATGRTTQGQEAGSALSCPLILMLCMSASLSVTHSRGGERESYEMT